MMDALNTRTARMICRNPDCEQVGNQQERRTAMQETQLVVSEPNRRLCPTCQRPMELIGWKR